MSDATRRLYADLHRRLAFERWDGFLPAGRDEATLEQGRTVPFTYRCMLCGQWHPVPEPCPERTGHED